MTESVKCPLILYTVQAYENGYTNLPRKRADITWGCYQCITCIDEGEELKPVFYYAQEFGWDEWQFCWARGLWKNGRLGQGGRADWTVTIEKTDDPAAPAVESCAVTITPAGVMLEVL